MTGGAMGWTAAEVAACGLAEFTACWEGFAALHGIGQPTDALADGDAAVLRAEFFGDPDV